MLLHCTLAGHPVSGIGEPVELSIDVHPGCPGAALQDAVAAKFGPSRLTVAGVPLAALVVGTAPLLNGAVLVADGPVGGPAVAPAPPGTSLLLAVLSGPGAGTVLPLRRGSYRIGRSGTELTIPDAELSREHARLDVADAGITLVDLGSANGSYVHDRRVSSAPVSTDSLLHCGHSTLAVLFGGPAAGPGGSGPAGLRGAGSDVSEPLRISGHGPAAPRMPLVLAAVLPLTIGVALAVATGMWMFLALTAASAVPMLLSIVSGRRQRREWKETFAAAVREDGERRRRAAPSAAGLVLGAAALAPGADPAEGAEAEPAETGPVWLRLGLAAQPANIRADPAVFRFRSPPAGSLPLTLDPLTTTWLDGPVPSVAGLVRFLVMQLAGYPRASGTSVHLHGPGAAIPLAARFLPRVSLSASAAAASARLAAGPGAGCVRAILVLLSGADGAEDLRAEASRLGWQVISCSAARGPGQTVTLRERGARLTAGGTSVEFVADLVPEAVFDRFCRLLAASDRPTGGPSTVPVSCTLDEVLVLSEAEISRRWQMDRQSSGRSGLAVPVGRAAHGPLVVDLEADGPHLLVAGTTGAGKSEFLRTLAAALAACYPPDRVNLLFMDFKGGSGLGPLTRLPHCVGLLTDLDGYEVDRTLASLRAEVRRREVLLAAAGQPDLASYQASGPKQPALPRLVLVIDEFRMLVEDAPAALAELMRIAVIGRSLGIHLVMATQRPQGALTADIRANVTSCVVLRVQSELESADVLDCRLAAAIPLGAPGRAFLRRGTGAPEEFQTATLGPGPSLPVAAAITVVAAAVLLEDRGIAVPAAGPRSGSRTCAATPAEAAGPFAELTARLWHRQDGVTVRRPVAPPLPPVLLFPGPEPVPGNSRRGAPPAREVLLGIADLPEEQRVGRLCWVPDRHSHLALIGGTHDAPGSSTEVLLLALDQLVWADAESHLYLLDGDGALSRTADSPRVGARVGPQEVRRAARVLARVAEEMTRRLDGQPAAAPPPIVLVLHNWGSWVSAFRAGPLAWAEDLVQDIVRGGPRAGIAVILSGERELVTARFFAAVSSRVYFPLGSTEESRLAWPPLPQLPPLPGRVAVAGMTPGDGAFSGSGGASAASTIRVAQLYTAPAEGAAGSSCPRRGGTHRRAARLESRPFRVEPLPAVLAVDEVRSGLGVAPQQPGPGNGTVRLWMGVGGDELQPAAVTLPPGSVLAVLGGPGSGKSTLLRTLALLNPATAWLRPGTGTGQEEYWAGIHAQATAGALARSAILLADDADLCGTRTSSLLLELNSLGWTVIFTAGFSPAVQHRVPLALQARSHGQGILLCPRTLMDGDLFGVRFELEPRPPAGRAVVIADGRATAVQVALTTEEQQQDSPGPSGRAPTAPEEPRLPGRRRQ